LATTVYAKSTPSSFDYTFNCNDKNSFCVHVRKQLASAVSSLSSIFEFNPPLKMDIIMDDISKHRSATTSDIYGAAVNTTFELLYSKKGIISSPYPNAQTLINTFDKQNKFADDDFLLLLNNFNSNPDSLEAATNDYQNNAIKEIYKGLLSLDLLPEPYKSSSGSPGGMPPPPPGGSGSFPPPGGSGGFPPPGGSGGMPPPMSSDICSTLQSNRNTESFMEKAKSNDESCAKSRANKLSSILSWNNKLLSKDTSKSQNYKRLVAIGDIHGDYNKLVEIFRHAKLINKNNKWIASNTLVVQTGDLIDRGEDIKKIHEFLIDLIDQAKKKKSEIHLLLGNHEVYNLQANYGFVSTGDINNFGGLENREALYSPTGKLGKLVRAMDVAFIANESLFAHAGVLPEYAEEGIDNINNRVRNILQNAPSFDEMCQMSQSGNKHALFTEPVLNDHNGPLTTRRFSTEDENTICPELERTLQITNTKRMIIGHTVQEYGEIMTRCDGKLILIDVGMSGCYGGFFGYMEFLNNKKEIWAIHS